MKNFLLAGLVFLFPSPVFAYFYTLQCEGNYQPEVGSGTEKIILENVDAGGFGDAKYIGTLRDYDYEVIWHKSLDTFYMTIKQNGRNILFSTARVPTFEHNDTMADITPQDATRRWISCGFKPK